MNDKSRLDTHDERQSAYRGNGSDASVDGQGRNDPSAVQTGDAQPPRDGTPEAFKDGLINATGKRSNRIRRAEGAQIADFLPVSAVCGVLPGLQ
ncbi:hypothetical protein FQJ87_23465, partial [Xanthomonas vasicola]